MTGYDVLKRAMALLGFSEQSYEPIGTDKINLSGKEIINQILADLKEKEIASLSDKLVLSTGKGEAIHYGVAMLLSLSEGDTAKNQAFAGIYNAKRAEALKTTERIADVIPNITEGG